MPNWEKDLKRGEDGERVLMSAFKMVKSNDRRWDLITQYKKKLELKTCFLGHGTGNFAIEQFSNKEKQTIGGVDRAVRDGADVFAYLIYYAQKCYFWKPSVLKEEVSKANKWISETTNRKGMPDEYTTTNQIIKIADLEGSCFRVETIDKKHFK